MAATDMSSPISTLRRLWLWLELLLLYVAAPVAMDWMIHTFRVPPFVALVPALLLFVIVLLADRTFSLKAALMNGFGSIDLITILVLFALATPIVLAITQAITPDRYLEFPTRALRLWLFVMLLYPLLSVVAQEIIYRVFFFHRYRVLFGSRVLLMILANGALFAFGHIMFRNWPSIWMSLIGGCLFAWRYHRTGSFWAVFLEHSLYGNLVFTAGLGRYFFTGISMFR